MDEYMFEVMAKLQADRRKLEREQRATSQQRDRTERRNTRPQYFREKPPLRIFLAWR